MKQCHIVNSAVSRGAMGDPERVSVAEGKPSRKGRACTLPRAVVSRELSAEIVA